MLQISVKIKKGIVIIFEHRTLIFYVSRYNNFVQFKWGQSGQRMAMAIGIKKKY